MLVVGYGKLYRNNLIHSGGSSPGGIHISQLLKPGEFILASWELYLQAASKEFQKEYNIEKVYGVQSPFI